MSATIETLEEFRSDASWSHLYSYVQQVEELNEIAIAEYQQKCQRRLPSRSKKVLYSIESVGSRESMSTSDEYKVNVYFPISEFSCRT